MPRYPQSMAYRQMLITLDEDLHRIELDHIRASICRWGELSPSEQTTLADLVNRLRDFVAEVNELRRRQGI